MGHVTAKQPFAGKMGQTNTARKGASTKLQAFQIKKNTVQQPSTEATSKIWLVYLSSSLGCGTARKAIQVHAVNLNELG